MATFNVHWDDLLEVQMMNIEEIYDKNEFEVNTGIDPSIFDEEFDEEKQYNVTKLLTDSQLSEYSKTPVSTECLQIPETAAQCSQAASDQYPQVDENHSAVPVLTDVASENMNKGFMMVDMDSVKAFNESEKNQHTKRKTNQHINRLKAFLQLKNETRDFHSIPMTELDELLAMFLLSIKKVDGTDYEPSSLRGYISTFDRVLQENGYQFTIAKSSRQGFPLTNQTKSVITIYYVYSINFWKLNKSSKKLNFKIHVFHHYKLDV